MDPKLRVFCDNLAQLGNRGNFTIHGAVYVTFVEASTKRMQVRRDVAYDRKAWDEKQGH